MTTSESVGKVFANLSRWRHFPNYQLERRTDIFFSIYLKDILEAYLRQKGSKVELLDIIIPELPLKTGKGALSFKVDYVLFSRDLKTVYLVELKTDVGSIRDSQCAYLKDAARHGLKRILSDLVEIVGRTASRRKYYHLLFWLRQAGVLEFPQELRECNFANIERVLPGFIKEVRPTAAANAAGINIIYVVPESSGIACCEAIDFAFVIEHLSKHDDELSRAFADNLGKWVRRAGDDAPADGHLVR